MWQQHGHGAPWIPKRDVGSWDHSFSRFANWNSTSVSAVGVSDVRLTARTIVAQAAAPFFGPCGVSASWALGKLDSDEVTSRGSYSGLVYGLMSAVPSGVGVALAVTGGGGNALVRSKWRCDTRHILTHTRTRRLGSQSRRHFCHQLSMRASRCHSLHGTVTATYYHVHAG